MIQPFIKICFFVLSCLSVKAQVYDLKVEHLNKPLGIDNQNPRFSWKQQSGVSQKSYQIWIGDDSLQVKNAQSFTSKKVKSSENLVTLSDFELKPYTTYYWKVEIEDSEGKRNLSAIERFETGHMNISNWKGDWISDGRDINLKPAPYFRHSFSTTKKVVSARAYIATAGLFELYINGDKIGHNFLDPNYTRFDRRILYVSHDVTKEVKTGNNAIGVILGNGWYNHQSTAVWFFDKAPWRNRPAFCMDLRIVYDDGTVETISSGKEWKTTLGPIIFNSIYTAEHYDARKEIPGWNLPEFNDSKWNNASLRAAPSLNIVSQVLTPIREVEEIKTHNLTKLNDTTHIYDFGRNIAGITEFTIKGTEGTVFKLKHGERLSENSRIDMSNIDAHYRPTDESDPFQTDIYILSGKGIETFKPRFNYKGFQYVEVTSSKPIDLKPENLKAHFIHSDVSHAGKINSSNSTLNKIWYATNNSYLSNLVGYPTDCPQREKNGWTGDAHIAIETGLFNFDAITVYEKWMTDHRDEQQPNGVLPAIIPTSGWGYHWANGPDWTSTIAIIPWNLYLFYGDKKPLEDNYDNIKRYIDHIQNLYPDGLTSWGLGDWIPVKSNSPVELTSTAYYFTDVTILAKTAQLLAKTDDYNKYSQLAQKIKKAFNAKYLNSENAIYGSGLQTELAVPLYWGLVPNELKQKVADNLAQKVKNDGTQLDVGLLGTKAILQALSDNGHEEIAYALATRETFPSWGWWIVNGATTLYENWPIDAKSDISMNHIMFGEIGAWFYKALGGIKPDVNSPGFKNIILEPKFVNDLQFFESQHESPFGTIYSNWKRVKNSLEYTVTIPSNSTATIKLPVQNGKTWTLKGKALSSLEMQLPAGVYTFKN